MPTSDDYVIRGIPCELIDKMWPFAEPFIKRALDHTSGEFSAADIRQNCIDREVQLWLVALGNRIVGAMTTEIIQYPTKKHCRVVTVAGKDVDQWADQLDRVLVEWALSLGCTGIEANVRRGMVQKLEPYGYKNLYSVVHKKLIIPDKEAGKDSHG